MKTILLILLLALQSLFVFSQEDKTNIRNSIGEKTGLWLYYDADSVLFKKVWYSNGGSDSVLYFDVQGKKIDTIIPFSKLILKKDIAIQLKQIKQKIINEFDWRNVLFREGKGKVVISFIITPKSEISNVRVINGISKSLNQELIRAVYNLDKEDFECINDKNFPVLVYIPISF